MPIRKENWILAGYELFALTGANGLKVERIAEKVGISKSSFYHHFADMEVFMNFLLTYHLEQSQLIARKESKANTIEPELIDILVEHKIDLLFNRQLRINQVNKIFYDVMMKSNLAIGEYFIALWIKDLALKITLTQAQGIFELALENFFLQVNAENLNASWLSSYFKNLKNTVHKIY